MHDSSPPQTMNIALFVITLCCVILKWSSCLSILSTIISWQIHSCWWGLFIIQFGCLARDQLISIELSISAKCAIAGTFNSVGMAFIPFSVYSTRLPVIMRGKSLENKMQPHLWQLILSTREETIWQHKFWWKSPQSSLRLHLRWWNNGLVGNEAQGSSSSSGGGGPPHAKRT